jgi:hypothetical protein
VANRKLEYTITGDARDFQKALRTVDRGLATSEKNAHSFSRGVASALGTVGHAAGLAGAAIGAGLVLEVKSAVRQFQESNKVARQTEAVLRSTGGAANVTAKQVSNLATALSRKTGIDDEVVQSGENMLLTFRNIRNEAGKGNDIFNQSTRVLLDMSKALGVDSAKAAIQLGKALNDPVKGITALRRVGVTFTDQQQKQIDTLVKSGKTLAAQKLILRELTAEFGGSARAQATSTEKLKVAFGNLQEDIGSGLAPAVDAIANKLTKFAIDVEPKVIRAADNIAKTFGRKDLSLDQKFRLSYDQARDVFKPLVDEAQASIAKMHLGDKLSNAVSSAVPKILDTFAAHAPQAAETFAKAFIGAGVWGRLFAIGWLLKKTNLVGSFRRAGEIGAAETAAGAAVGGVGRGRGGVSGVGGRISPEAEAFRQRQAYLMRDTAPTVGFGRLAKSPALEAEEARLAQLERRLANRSTIGGTLGGGVAAGGIAAGAAKGAGLFGKLRGVGAGAAAAFGETGVGLGIAGGLILGPELIKPFLRDNKSMSQAVQEVSDKAEKSAKGSMPRYIASLREAAREARATGLKIDRDLGGKIDQTANKAVAAFGASWVSTIDHQWGEFSHRIIKNASTAADFADERFAFIRKTIGRNTRAGRDAATENFKQLADVINKQMDDGSTSVARATKVIKRHLATDSHDGRVAAADEFQTLAARIRGRMHDGEVSVAKGTQRISELLAAALSALGYSGKQAHGLIKTAGSTRGPQGASGQNSNEIALTRETGGWIGSQGMRGQDTVPVMLGAGEAVLNRHQQGVVEGLLGQGFLDRLFSKVRTPHYMARGGYVEQPQMMMAAGGRIPAVSVRGDLGAVSALAQRAVNVDRAAAQSVLDASSLASSAVNTVGASAHGLVAQVKRAIAWARGHGWSGSITSGLRSTAKQQYLWDHASQLGLVRGVSVARPGTSEHERGRAIDVSDIAGFQRAMASAPPGARLLWRGPSDPVHFSVSGHARGGFIRRFASGGRLSHADLARLWIRAGGDPGRSDVMAAIALAESGGSPSARNASGASGLWQILGQEVPGNILDPLTNARNAVWKFRHQGLGAWVVYSTGAYKGFLTGNNASAPSGGSNSGGSRAQVARAKGVPAGAMPTGKLSGRQQTTHGPTTLQKQAAAFGAQTDASGSFYDQQVTDLQNTLTIRGIDPTSAQGLGVIGLQAQTRLISLRARQKQLRAMLKAARHGGDRKAVKSIKQQLAAVHSQILGQRATITGLSNDYAAATAPATPLDFANADFSLAQLNDTEDPASLGDNLTALQKIQGLDQGALNDALQSGDPRKVGEAADALKSVSDNIKALQDAIDANTNALKDQKADLATELKRQNDQMAAVRGSLQSTLTQYLADQVGGRVGAQAVLAAQTPGFAGQRSRY